MNGQSLVRTLRGPLSLSVPIALCGFIASAFGVLATFPYAECHFIERAGTPSPNTAAPPFAAVANTPGMTDVALAVFLYTPHPTMPNLVIPTPDARDIIAYILTLKR
jgi:hypothetical protein